MNDRQGMELALAQARLALGRTHPNPAVGAVLVRDGRVLSQGHTQPPGGEHAEVNALSVARAIGEDPRGATMYVTLEPCCHHGRTPPCTEAILAAGVRRVVVGIVDPYPPMQGRGLALLRSAGVEVELGMCAEACAGVVRGFLRATTLGLPEVSLKAAISLDGHLATASGASKWITGERARAQAHVLRSEHDAVLVGIRTVLADDPRLTARHEGAAQPVPVVLDSALRIPAEAAVLRGPQRALIVAAEDAPQRRIDADILRVPRGPGGLDVREALRAVVQRGLNRVLVEGGGLVHRSLLDAGLVDQLYLFVAPMVIPGGRPWLGGPPAEGLAGLARWPAPAVSQLGDDLLLHYVLRPPEVP